MIFRGMLRGLLRKGDGEGDVLREREKGQTPVGAKGNGVLVD